MKLRAFGLRQIVTTGLIAVGLAGLTGTAAASPRAPFSDPNAVGYIGLCNEAGHQITSGNINTVPLAWRAVSSQPAPAPYNNVWRTAILLAFQPQQDLSPSEWSGDELTASSRYSNPAHPMAAATGGDDSLADFIAEFRPKWDGYLELRMYLGTQNAEVYSLRYPVLDIQVTGDTWHAVGGGPVNCHHGTAESLESMLLPKTDTSLPPTTVNPSPAKARSSKTATSGLTAASGASDHSIVLVIISVLVVLAAAGLLITRRRRSVPHPLPAPRNRRTSTKGH